MKPPELNFRKLKLAVNCFLGFAALVAIVAVFVPFTPRMPSGGLDPSCEFGLNQAAAQGFIFGKELVFTFGPYDRV